MRRRAKERVGLKGKGAKLCNSLSRFLPEINSRKDTFLSTEKRRRRGGMGRRKLARRWGKKGLRNSSVSSAKQR